MGKQHKGDFLKAKEIKSLTNLEETCRHFIKTFKVPQLVLLEGPVAVGKSQMVRYMAEALGCSKEDFCSPTFSLINVYKTKKESIYHVDLYRLDQSTDIEAIAFWDIFYETSIVFIEWPRLVKKKLPPLWNQLYIELSFFNSHRFLKWEYKKGQSGLMRHTDSV